MNTKPNIDVFCIGSVTTDLFLHADTPIESLPTAHGQCDFFLLPVGEKLALFDTKKYCGGGAANTSIGFVKAGFTAAAVSHTGHDDHSRYITETLKSENVSTDYIDCIPDSESSFSIILMGADGRRTVLHERVASPSKLIDLCSLQPQKGVYIGHIMQDEEALLFDIPKLKACSPDISVGWNPGKTQFKNKAAYYKDIFPHIDMLILNVEEAEQFIGLHAPKVSWETFSASDTQILSSHHAPCTVCDVRILAQSFFDLGLCTVVITDGKHGAHLITPDQSYYIPGSGAKPKSTLGAGDAFSVGAFTALLYGQNTATQLLWGSRNAESVIQSFGAQSGLLTHDELSA